MAQLPVSRTHPTHPPHPAEAAAQAASFEAASAYAPPKAAVEDIAAGPAPERPPEVARAVKCLWIVFGIGIVTSVWQIGKFLLYTSPATRGAMGGAVMVPMMVGYVLMFAISYVIYGAIGRGRNWARVLYLIFAGLSLLWFPFMLMALMQGLRFFGFEQLVGTLNIVIGAYAGYLLLTAPAREWFSAMKGR